MGVSKGIGAKQVSFTHQLLEAENKALRAAMVFYSERHHFMVSEESAWDTVSGEPANFWCDEAGTATVEDGSVARDCLNKGETIRRSMFMAASKGLSSTVVARALNTMTHGVNWSGCSRSTMADYFAKRSCGKSSAFDGSFDLDRLRRLAIALASGDPNWSSVN